MSVSQRFRKLSREYGWSALGVYLLLSAIDFPICFAALRLFGVERIGHLEHVVVESIKNTAAKAVGSDRRTTATEEDSIESKSGDTITKAAAEKAQGNAESEPSMFLRSEIELIF